MILKTHVGLFSDCGISVLSMVLVFKAKESCSEGLVLAESYMGFANHTVQIVITTTKPPWKQEGGILRLVEAS